MLARTIGAAVHGIDAIKVETTPGEGSISISTFQELHNFWRMDTRDFSHERKCAIAPFLRTYIRISAFFVL
jgi:hypothetical protein